MRLGGRWWWLCGAIGQWLVEVAVWHVVGVCVVNGEGMALRDMVCVHDMGWTSIARRGVELVD